MMMLLPMRNFATKIMGGSTNNKKDSAGRRLGIKKWGHTAEIYRGDILLKQRGLKYHPGMHVKTGRDHTLHSKIEVSAHHQSDYYSIDKTFVIGANRLDSRPPRH